MAETQLLIGDLIEITETYMGEDRIIKVRQCYYVHKVTKKELFVNSCIIGNSETDFIVNDPMNRRIDLREFSQDPTKSLTLIHRQ